jgi:hypothetical protein
MHIAVVVLDERQPRPHLARTLAPLSDSLHARTSYQW